MKTIHRTFAAIIVFTFVMLSQPASAADNHVFILIHGTKYEGLDVTMDRMKKDLTSRGYSADRIVIPTYNSENDWEGIRSELGPQLVKIVEQFGPNQHFVVITHSLGEFAGLYTLVKTPDPFLDKNQNPADLQSIAARVDLYIGLAGIAHGIDGLAPFPENPVLNRIAVRLAEKTIVSEADEALIPQLNANPRLQKFYADEAKRLNRDGLRKCAIYSPNDRLVREPLEAGKISEDYFPVPANILPLYGLDSQNNHTRLYSHVLDVMTRTHLEFIYKPEAISFMLDKCQVPKS